MKKFLLSLLAIIALSGYAKAQDIKDPVPVGLFGTTPGSCTAGQRPVVYNGDVYTCVASVYTKLATTAAGGSISGLTANRVTVGAGPTSLQDFANFTYDGTTLTVAALKDTGLTSGRVPYVTTGGLLTDSANFTFDIASDTLFTVVGTNSKIRATAGTTQVELYSTSGSGQIRTASNHALYLQTNNSTAQILLSDTNHTTTIGSSTLGNDYSQLSILVGASTVRGAVIKLATSQSADAFQVQDSSGNVQSYISAAGIVSTYGAGSGVGTYGEFRLKNGFTRVASGDSGGGWGGGYNFDWNDAGPKHNSTGALAGFGFNSSAGVRWYTNASAAAGTSVASLVRWQLSISSPYNISIGSGQLQGWTASADGSAAIDTALGRNAAGILEINNGTAGTYRDLRLRGIGVGTAPTPTTAGIAVNVSYTDMSVSNYGMQLYANTTGVGGAAEQFATQSLYYNSASGTTQTGALYGGVFGVVHNAASDTSLAIGLRARIQNFSTGNVTDGRGIDVFTPAFSSTGVITTNQGIYIRNQGVSGITSASGITIAAQSGATNNTALLIGTTTIPSGNFGIYNSSTNGNYFAGTMGIGTAAPSVYQLQVAKTSTSTSGTEAGAYTAEVITPASASTAQATGIFGVGTWAGTQDSSASGYVQGGQFSGIVSGSAKVYQAAGAIFTGSNTSSAGSTLVIGGVFSGQNSGGGTVPNVRGGLFWAQASAASIITNATAVFAGGPSLSGGATVGTAYGTYVQNQASASTTTAYGIYLENQTGSTTNYAIYSAGGASLLNAGTNTVVPLTIKGAASQSGDYLDIVEPGGTVINKFTSAGRFYVQPLTNTAAQVDLVATGTGVNNFNFSTAGGTGLFQLDAAGNMVFRQSAATMFFDYFTSLRIRGANDSFNNQIAWDGTLFYTRSGFLLRWDASATNAVNGTPDLGIGRNAAGVLEINNGTAGTLRDLTARGLTLSGNFFVGPSTIETFTTNASALGTLNYYTDSQTIYYDTAAATGNVTLNVKAAAGTNLDSRLATGQSITFVLKITNTGTPYNIAALNIDGSAQTIKWLNGSAPSGNANAVDTYTFYVYKTGTGVFYVEATQQSFK